MKSKWNCNILMFWFFKILLPHEKVFQVNYYHSAKGALSKVFRISKAKIKINM
jgi:hypothetical protein